MIPVQEKEAKISLAHERNIYKSFVKIDHCKKNFWALTQSKFWLRYWLQLVCCQFKGLRKGQTRGVKDRAGQAMRSSDHGIMGMEILPQYLLRNVGAHYNRIHIIYIVGLLLLFSSFIRDCLNKSKWDFNCLLSTKLIIIFAYYFTWLNN